MRRSKRTVTFGLVLALSLSGCMSYLDIDWHHGQARPYGGVRLWFGDDPHGMHTFHLALWIWVLPPLLDLPLCAVFDTLALPYALLTSRDRERARADRPQAPPPPARGETR